MSELSRTMDALRDKHDGWEIWWTARAVDRPVIVYHARRWGEREIIHADTVPALELMLRRKG